MKTILLTCLILTITINAKAQDIIGYVWEDSNGDGIQDTTELPIDGVTINLLDEFGNPVGLSDVTGGMNPSGEYRISGAVAGTVYRLDFSGIGALGGDYYATIPFASADNTVNSNIDQTTLQSMNFTMPMGDQTDIDGGFYKAAEVSGRVWVDEDANGLRTGAENLSLPAGVNMTFYKYGQPATLIDGITPATIQAGNNGDWVRN